MPDASNNGNVYVVARNEPTNNEPTASVDNLVPIRSRSDVFKQTAFFRNVSVILAILVIILLVAFIAALFDYLQTRSSLEELKKNRICNSEECLRSAANLKLSMNLSTDPCDDFYKYTCGHWTREHPNHGWYPHFSSFEAVDERVAIATLEFLQSNISKKEPLPVRQARDLYLSCMNTGSLDRLGYSVLFKYLKKVYLPAVPNFFTKAKGENFTFDWIKTEVALKKTFAMDTLIGLLVDADIYKRNKNVIYMGTPGTSCPLPSPFKSDKKAPTNRKNGNDSSPEKESSKEKAYKKIIKRVIKDISLNATGNVPQQSLLHEAAGIIWNLTKDFEDLMEVNKTDYDLQFYKMKVDELQNITDKYLILNGEMPKVIWRSYLTRLFKGVPNVTLNLDKNDYLYIPVQELGYLPEIAYYLSKVPDLVLELYMWWVTVNAMILSTSSEVTEFIAKETIPFTRVEVYRPRSIDCATLVISFMGLAVSYGIVDKQFLNNTKPKVEQMLNDIKDAFVERVDSLNWMDAKTQKATLEKSKEMISFIGFPEWLLDCNSLESYYSNIKIKNDTFLENMMDIIKKSTLKELQSLREKNQRTWKTDPITVNAYNYFSDNSIMVPMAILTHPFYNLGLEALNYGAIGSVLGHELTHGFDNTGRKFDKWGNYKQWWSNKTIATFEKKTKCFIKQYEKLKIPSVNGHVNGKQTLGENLADNGGLHHAFRAYQNYVKKNGEELKLPGFEDFSNFQIFFIAYGSIWCETLDKEALRYQLENDEHCPSSLRVLGTLQNSEDFADAFGCEAGTKMNPNRTKCRIW